MLKQYKEEKKLANEYIISDKEKQEYIEYMLANKDLEKALGKWKRHKRNDDYMFQMLEVLVESAKNQKGMIIAVKSDNMPIESNQLDFIDINKKYEMHHVTNKKDESYIMVFTSKERFKKCTNISGVVVFIDELIIAMERRKDVNGIVINLEKEEIILDKILLRAIIWTIMHSNKAH